MDISIKKFSAVVTNIQKSGSGLGLGNEQRLEEFGGTC